MSRVYYLQPLFFLILFALCFTPSKANWKACYGQPNGAVIPLKYDCHMYLYCLNQSPIYKRCPYGQGFSTKTTSCVIYSNSDCINWKNPKQGGTCDNEQRPENRQACKGQPFGELVPYPGDCAKFLVCNCKYPTVKNCPNGTWFDNKIKTCNYPQNVECDDGALTGTTKTTDTTITDKTTTEMSKTTKNNDWGEDCDRPEGLSADICLKYENGVLLRYPYNCNAYINCTQGCPVMQYCQTDKVFNNFLKICDTPDTAHCIELPLPGGTTTSMTTAVSTEISNTTEDIITTTNTPRPKECLEPIDFDSKVCWSNAVYERYPYNCTGYVVCREDKPCLEYCENGKIYNNLLGICDADMQCHEIPLPSTTTTETPNSSTTTEVSVSTNTPLPPDVDSDLCQCKQDYTTYPFKADCSKYLQCLKDQVEVKSCPQGWLFNAQLLLCDKASEEVCYKETSTSPTATPTTATTSEPIYDLCIGQPEGTTFPYKENCQKYYFCRSHGQYYIISCPYNNYYDPYSGNCGPDVTAIACLESITTTTIKATTLSPEEKCENQQTGTTYPYEENCQKYIFCKGKGGYYILNCPYGNYYYPDSGDCGPSDNVNVCREQLTTTSTATITSTTSTKTTETTTTSTNPQPELPALSLCGNQSNGELIAYPHNCQKYISCVKPIPIGFYCDSNWYFNAEQQKCVADRQGSCQEMPYPETTTLKPPSAVCNGLGEGDWQTYINDCQFYYECLDDGNAMLKSCPQNQYFNPLTGKCTTQVSAEYCKQNFGTTTTSPPAGTTPIAKPQGICAGQNVGSKISYPHNCTKYIECAIPIPMGYNCPSGLEFSTEQQECVAPKQSDCGLLTTTTTEPTTKPLNLCTNKPDFTLLLYKQNCAMYIICLEDTEHLAYCQDGQYFDIYEMKCLPNSNEDSCRLNATTETPESSTTDTTTDPNLDPCYKQPEGTKFPYPNNCSKYIECRKPLPVGYDCPEDLEFSDYYKECVIPALSDCGIKATTTTEITSTITNTPTAETCANKPTGSTLPYPQDCSKYYMCINGQEKLVNCIPNSYYDPRTGECDMDISPTACKDSTLTTTTTTEPTLISTTSKPTLEGLCKNEPNGYIYANIVNCTQYYICLEGTSVLCQCQQTTYYNPYNKECDRQASETACIEAINTSTTIETTSTATSTSSSSSEISTTTTANAEPAQGNICCGHKSGTYLAYPGDHTKYVICKYPVPEIYNCPTGFYYATNGLSCKSDTTDDAFTRLNCDSDNYGRSLVFQGDCNKYYFCFGSRLVIQACDFNWYFNPALGKCVPRNYYNCPW